MIFKESKARPLVITAPAARPQIRDASSHPFQSVFNDYKPLKHNIGLFRSIREAIPFLNIGILKRRKLIGSFEFTEVVGGASAEKALNWLKEKVNVNWLQYGLDSFISEKVNSGFEAGTGYGEIVVGETSPRLHHLETCKPDNIRFVRDKETGRWLIARYTIGSIEPVPFPDQDKITYLAFDTRDGHPQGYSLLYGLPFVTQILLRQEKSWENMAFMTNG